MKKLPFRLFLITIFSLMAFQYQDAFAEKDGIDRILDTASSIESNKRTLGNYGVKNVTSEGFETKIEDLGAFEMQLDFLVGAMISISNSVRESDNGVVYNVKATFENIDIKNSQLYSHPEISDDGKTLNIYVDEDSSLNAEMIFEIPGKLLDIFITDTYSPICSGIRYFNVVQLEALVKYLTDNKLVEKAN